jgi:hypothetical protein
MDIFEAIQLAIPVFHEHKDSTWKTLGEALKEAGIPAILANRLLEFMPLAFGRAFVDGMGIEFGEYYIRFNPKTNKKVSKRLAEEPVYTQSFAAATSLMTQKQAGDEVMSVIVRSSEFTAMNKALNDGSHVKDLVASPPVLLWDEEASDQAGDGETTRSKSKWKFWK